MRTECAVLCDAASVREGLLHILGAGVTQVSVAEFPAALPVTFAFRVVLEPRELRSEHRLRVQVMDYSADKVLGQFQFDFRVQKPDPVREEAAFAAPIPLEVLRVPAPGQYVFEATFDHTRLASIPLRVQRIESPDADT